jgi:RNase P/RNase MRP subunit p30
LKSSDYCDGYLLKTSEKEARRIIDSLKGSGKIIALSGGDDSFNRRAIETLKIDYLVSPEGNFKRNTLKQRDSGINHVVAKEAKLKKISFIIDISEIRNLGKIEKSLRLESLIQNIKICKRADSSIKMANLSKNKNILMGEMSRKSFGMSLGMSSEQSRESTNFKR